jgi:ABC-2 type transport system permease protein
VNGFAPIFVRELRALWVTPLAWVLTFAFLVLQGTSFVLMIEHYNQFINASLSEGPIQGYFASLFVPVTLLLVCPALSMRTFAEERRSGTLEVLMTAPVSPLGVVLGKFMAAWCTYAGMWLPTFLYVIILRDTGVVDWGVVGASYFGIGLIGGTYIAIGTLMSALTQSQLVAMMLTTLVLFGLFIVGIGEQIFEPGPLLDICRHISILSQLDDFSRGLVDSRRVVLDVSAVGFVLFLCVRVVDSWRRE